MTHDSDEEDDDDGSDDEEPVKAPNELFMEVSESISTSRGISSNSSSLVFCEC